MAKSKKSKSKEESPNKGSKPSGKPQPAARRVLADLEPPFGQTMIVDCSEGDDYPQIEDEIELQDGHESAIFADEAMPLLMDIASQWWDVPEPDELNYNRSLWTTRDDRTGGQVILIVFEIESHGLFTAVIAPPGDSADEATTGIWIGLQPDGDA